MKPRLAPSKIIERNQRIRDLKAEHPEYSQGKIGAMVGVSQATVGNVLNPEGLQRRNERLRERWVNEPEYREKTKKMNRQRSIDPEWRREFNERQRERRSDPDRVFLKSWTKEFRQTFRGIIFSAYYSAKYRAKKQGVAFNITMDDLLDIWTGECACGCGKPMEHNTGRATNNSVSLDKVIPSLGYIPGNIQFLRHECNSQKRNLTLADFRRLESYIIKYAPPGFNEEL